MCKMHNNTADVNGLLTAGCSTQKLSGKEYFGMIIKLPGAAASKINNADVILQAIGNSYFICKIKSGKY